MSSHRDPENRQSSIDIDTAICPAVTTWEPQKVRQRPHLIPDQLLGGRDFRRMVLRDNFPLPDDSLREGYYLGKDVTYWLRGPVDFLKVMQIVDHRQLQPHTILDFGSASGRVARHFANQLDGVSVWAGDINPHHVRWMQRHIPRRLKPFLVSELPAVPLIDNSVDLICAFSVFTHIDEHETEWLEEMQRVLRPGGLACFTVHNEATWAALAELDASNRLIQSMIRTGRFQFDDLQRPMPEERLVYEFSETGPYRYQVFHRNDYIEKQWGRRFEICEIQPRAHQRQSMVVMTKRGAVTQRES